MLNMLLSHHLEFYSIVQQSAKLQSSAYNHGHTIKFLISFWQICDIFKQLSDGILLN